MALFIDHGRLEWWKNCSSNILLNCPFKWCCYVWCRTGSISRWGPGAWALLLGEDGCVPAPLAGQHVQGAGAGPGGLAPPRPRLPGRLGRPGRPATQRLPYRQEGRGQLTQGKLTECIFFARAVDLRSFFAAPDQAYFLNADPDQAAFLNADPDPVLQNCCVTFNFNI